MEEKGTTKPTDETPVAKKKTAPKKKAEPKKVTAKHKVEDRIIPNVDVRICVITKVNIADEFKGPISYEATVEKTNEIITFEEHKDDRKMPEKEASHHMEKVIEAYINKLASVDPKFKKRVDNPAKNIDDCLTYIINTVKDAKKAGWADSEIFGMAIHYYDEDDIKLGSRNNPSSYSVNHVVELTDKEIAEKKKEALDKVMKDEEARLKKKSAPKKKVVAVEKPSDELTLF